MMAGWGGDGGSKPEVRLESGRGHGEGLSFGISVRVQWPELYGW